MFNNNANVHISSTAKVHSTAILQGNIELEDDVYIGPYCLLDGTIKLGKGVKLLSHVVIMGNTSIQQNTVIYNFACVGSTPQDLKYNQEESFTEIGENNVIREHVTISSGTEHGGLYTKIGNNNLFMISSHIGHDCKIANNCIIANNTAIAGHVTLEDNVIIGGNSGIHQFVRIGAYSMVGGMSGVVNDVLPFCLYTGFRAKKIKRLNIIGLKRHGFSTNEIKQIKLAYNDIFSSSDIFAKANSMKNQEQHPKVKTLLDFILSDTSRSICSWDAK